MSIDVEALADHLMDLRMDGPSAEGETYQQTMRRHARMIAARLVPAEDEGRLLARWPEADLFAALDAEGWFRGIDTAEAKRATKALMKRLALVPAEDERRLREALREAAYEAHIFSPDHTQVPFAECRYEPCLQRRVLAATPEPGDTP